MSIHAFSGTQGSTATGFGSVNFQLTPEPATLALVLLAVAFLRLGRS